MSITDELREYAQIAFDKGSAGRARIETIADHIDAAHRSALEKLAAQLDEASDMRDFIGRIEQAAADSECVTLWGVDYTPLPVDADGVPIHVGERVQIFGNDQGTVSHMSLADDGWRVYVKYDGGLGTGSGEPRRISHYHTPTVEDVLREFADRVCNSGHQWGLDAADTIAEYAAKLRLAGEDE